MFDTFVLSSLWTLHVQEHNIINYATSAVSSLKKREAALIYEEESE